VGNLTPGGIGWWRNVGGKGVNWVFTRIVSNSLFAGATAVECGDIDRDGDLDVAATSRINDEVAWWENVDGSGAVWEKHSVQTNFYDAKDLFLGDIDQDGYLDIAAAGSSNVSYWISSFSGLAWSNHVISTFYNTPTSVTLVDMDTDKDLDLLFTASGTYAFTGYYRNDGGGAWVFRQIGLLNDGEQADAVDMDGDGDLDVVACSFNYFESLENLSWYQNPGFDTNGWGASAKTTVNTSFDGAFHITAADIDGDGDPDVVASAANNGGRPGDPDLQWWENTYTNRLTIHKSSTPLVLTDTNFSYTLAVSNEHAVAAADVTVTDYLPEGVVWVSDTSGAGPPAGNLLTWSIGALAAGASTSCLVNVNITTNVAPEIINAGEVRGVVLGAAGTNDRDRAVTFALDTDKDGSLNPFDEDDDGDLMPDAWELQYGLNPTNAADALEDRDGDSMNNLDEFISDTVPTNDLSYFRLEEFQVTSEIFISWSSSVARVYDVQCSANLLEEVWSNLYINLPGSNQVISVQGTNDASAAKYRVKVRIP
jgi:uncharacterized repeat protein (TIGR01451 family)